MTSAGLWNMSDSPSEIQGLHKSSPGISAGCHTPHPGSGVAELNTLRLGLWLVKVFIRSHQSYFAKG